MNIVPDNAQHIGARKEQQDAFGFSDLNRASAAGHVGALSVVADGMGGLEHGREMSRLACRTMIETYAGKSAGESIPEVLDRALRAANVTVLTRAGQLGVRGETGTTLSAAVIHDGGLYWTSVGDSRIYLYRDGMLTQLTVDHGYARLLDRQAAGGEISARAAAEHPERHAITSFLGLDSLDEIDCARKPFPLQPGDRILLCTDGLHGSLSDDEIRGILESHSTGAAQALVDAAVAKGRENQDNVTATLFDYHPNGAPVSGTARIAALPATVVRRAGRFRMRRVLAVALLMALLMGSAAALKGRGNAAVSAAVEFTREAVVWVWNWLPWPGAGDGVDVPEAPEEPEEPVEREEPTEPEEPPHPEEPESAPAGHDPDTEPESDPPEQPHPGRQDPGEPADTPTLLPVPDLTTPDTSRAGERAAHISDRRLHQGTCGRAATSA